MVGDTATSWEVVVGKGGEAGEGSSPLRLHLGLTYEAQRNEWEIWRLCSLLYNAMQPT